MTDTTTTQTGTCARCGQPSETIFHGHCAPRPFIFRSLGLAWDFAYRSKLPLSVVMGDCPQFWVVTHREAGWLLRAGYELAPKA
jgi:hypothetical protein